VKLFNRLDFFSFYKEGQTCGILNLLDAENLLKWIVQRMGEYITYINSWAMMWLKHSTQNLSQSTKARIRWYRE